MKFYGYSLYISLLCIGLQASNNQDQNQRRLYRAVRNTHNAQIELNRAQDQLARARENGEPQHIIEVLEQVVVQAEARRDDRVYQERRSEALAAGCDTVDLPN